MTPDEALAWALLELQNLKDYCERPERGEWGVECSICRNEWFDAETLAKFTEAKAALVGSE